MIASKIVVVVQARMGSSRLPGKVMLPVLGKTLLALMIERVQMSKHRFTVVIATSDDSADDIIATEAAQIGVKVYRGSQTNLLDRHYCASRELDADVVLKIPSDCPLIDPEIIDQVLGFYLDNDGNYDYVSNLHPATYPDGNDVEVMSAPCLKLTWMEASRPLELEHTTPFIWENPHLFHIGNVNWNTGLDYSMSHRFTIDYPDDYEFIKRVFEELYPQKPDFSCQDILDLLQRKPEIYELNTRYAGVNWYRNHLSELKTITPGQTKVLATSVPNTF
jgi:spore coat polysaccharide biosynthesis protein SpsF